MEPNVDYYILEAGFASVLFTFTLLGLVFLIFSIRKLCIVWKDKDWFKK